LLNKRMHISEFQQLISEKYEKRDRERGTPATFMWFIEEVGELSSALVSNDEKNKEGEFADVLAWLCTLANISDVDLEKACEKYTGNDINRIFVANFVGRLRFGGSARRCYCAIKAPAQPRNYSQQNHRKYNIRRS